MEKNLNKVRNNKHFRRYIYFTDVEIAKRFVMLYQDLFADDNGEANVKPNTNRMYKDDIGNISCTTLKGANSDVVYYRITLICDNDTWEYINKYNKIKRKKILIKDEFYYKPYYKSMLVYQ